MDLFEIVNGHIVPTVQALTTEPFKGIWNNDLTEDKEYAMQIFDYVEKLCSPKKSNAFYGIFGEARVLRVKKEVFGHQDYEIDTNILFAVMKYRELLEISCPSYPLLEDSLATAEGVRAYLKTLSTSMGSTTNSGALRIKPKEILAALSEVTVVVKRIETLRNEVNSEALAEGKTRGERIPGPYEE